MPGASTRAVVSVPPPGVKGEMMRTGRLGKSWAWARGAASSAAAARTARREAGMVQGMGVSSCPRLGVAGRPGQAVATVAAAPPHHRGQNWEAAMLAGEAVVAIWNGVADEGWAMN